jgi:transcriptional regulator with XRE-family HTH domain
MRSKSIDIMPPRLSKALKKLGADIAIARKKRQLTIEVISQRAGISKQTYQRLESGNPGVSLGVFAMVLFVLGEGDRLGVLLDMSTDDTGLLIDVAGLPKRVRSPK